MIGEIKLIKEIGYRIITIWSRLYKKNGCIKIKCFKKIMKSSYWFQITIKKLDKLKVNPDKVQLKMAQLLKINQNLRSFNLKIYYLKHAHNYHFHHIFYFTSDETMVVYWLSLTNNHFISMGGRRT